MEFITYICVNKKTLRFICIRKTHITTNEHTDGGFKFPDVSDKCPEENRGRIILHKGEETECIKNNFKY